MKFRNKYRNYNFTRHENWVNAIVFSNGGAIQASGSNATIKLWRCNIIKKQIKKWEILNKDLNNLS